MNLLRKTARTLFSGGSMESLIARSGQLLAIPFYHLVDDDACPHVDPIYPVRNSGLFRRDLDELLSHFEPVSLQDLLDRFEGDSFRPFERPVFHLTVDDGLRQVYSHMAPVLEEKGVPATFFLNSAFHNNAGLMYRYKAALLLSAWNSAEAQVGVQAEVVELLAGNPEHEFMRLPYGKRAILDKLAPVLGVSFEDFLKDYRPYLNDEEMTDLLARGFTFGSHSVDHPWFQEISGEEQLRQTLDAADWLDSKVLALSGTRPGQRVFAFPFSDAGISQTFFEQLQRAGIACTFGGSGIKQDITMNLARFPVEKSPEPMADILRTEYSSFILKGAVGKRRMKRP